MKRMTIYESDIFTMIMDEDLFTGYYFEVPDDVAEEYLKMKTEWKELQDKIRWIVQNTEEKETI